MALLTSEEVVLLDAAFYWPGISQGLVDTVPRVTFCSLWCLVKVGVSYVFFTGAVWFTMIPPELGSAPYGLQLEWGGTVKLLAFWACQTYNLRTD